MGARILLVAIEPALRPPLEQLLWGEGCDLSWAETASVGAVVASSPPDLAVVADSQALPALGDTPVVLLDADPERVAEEVRRRFPPPRDLVLSGAVVDLETRNVRRGDDEERLTPTEARLLRFMAAHPGEELPEEELLQKVWGYRKTVRSRTLVTTVYRLRRKVEADPAEPRNIVPVYGSGYRFVPQEALEQATRGNLPASRDSFVGRRTELDGLSQALSHARLVTLTGAGGTGKTRLALELAAQEGPRFESGAWVSDLTGARDRADVVRAVARTMRVPLTAADPTAQLTTALGYRGPLLLVLDNCEQVIADVADLVSGWLDHAPGLVVLATSREPLRLRGEHRWPLEPLGLPGGDDAPTVRASESGELFDHRGRAASPRFAVDDGNAPDVAAVVRLLDGLPLAVELAAARVDELQPAELARDLTTRLDALQSEDRDRPDRHRTLTATLDWSWALLGRAEREALLQLTVFQGGCTPEAAAEVLVLSGRDAVGDVLDRLVDKSLVRRWTTADGDERLGLLVSIRAWAAAKVPQSRAWDSEARHAAWYARFGANRALYGAGGIERQRQLGWEMDNVVTALRRCIARGEAPRASRLYAAAFRLYREEGPIAAAVDLADEVLAMQPLDDASQGLVSHLAGVANDRAGNMARAKDLLDTAVRLYRHLGDREMAALALCDTGTVLWRQAAADDAEGLYREALALAEGVGDRLTITLCLTNMAHLYFFRGDSDGARRAQEAALALAEEDDEYRNVAHILCQLGVLAAMRGDLNDAAELLDRSVTLSREIGARWTEAVALGNLGHVAWDRGASAEALARLEDALALHRDVGNRRSEAVIAGNVGDIHLQQGRLDVARRYLELALDVSREVNDPPRVGHWLGRLGLVHASSGRKATAWRCFEEGEAVLTDVAHWPNTVELLCGLARARLEGGDRAGAARAAARAREIAERIGLPDKSPLLEELREVQALL